MFYNLNAFDFKGKKVLVRAGFDTPLDENGNILDDERIVSCIPTLKFLLGQGAKVIIISHNGRPKGKVVERLKMDSTAKKLSELLGKDVKKLDDCIGEHVKEEISNMQEGDIILLENIRFYKQETENDTEFAKELASYADFYVNEVFSVSHRKQASITGIPKFIPGVAGFLLEKELRVIQNLIDDPKKPYIAILGGAKVSDKVELIKSLLTRVDKLLLGGAMVFTFFKAMGKNVGKSLVEDDKIPLAKELLENEKLVLPIDITVGDDIDNSTYDKNVGVDEIGDGDIGLDIGENSVEKYKSILKDAKTVVWNGPLGKFEDERFAKSTNSIATFLSTLDADVIIGGGDSALAVQKSGNADKMTHISTGGGAFLKFLENDSLPGTDALFKSYMNFNQE